MSRIRCTEEGFYTSLETKCFCCNRRNRSIPCHFETEVESNGGEVKIEVTLFMCFNCSVLNAFNAKSKNNQASRAFKKVILESHEQIQHMINTQSGYGTVYSSSSDDMYPPRGEITIPAFDVNWKSSGF